MIIAIGSKNPAKIKGIKRAFRKIYGRDNLKFKALKVNTTVPPQPIGLKLTLKGAIERAVYALNKASKADIGVGVEAGLIEVPYTITGFMDLEVCAIVDRDDRVTLGFSSAFEFPLLVIKSILERRVKEVEEIMERISGIKDIGDRMGAIGFLTRGVIDRCELTRQCVIMALVPRINPELYPIDKWHRVNDILSIL